MPSVLPIEYCLEEASFSAQRWEISRGHPTRPHRDGVRTRHSEHRERINLDQKTNLVSHHCSVRKRTIQPTLHLPYLCNDDFTQ
jgi:hypothetical protein